MEYTFYLFFIFIAGLIVGSFLSSYTYRTPRDKSVRKGRSYCPQCKSNVRWYDNIPLVSFLLLRGRCRNCDQKISFRYPLIEISTGIIFLAVAYLIGNCAQTPRSNDICLFYGLLGTRALPYLLLVATVLLSIFVIDLEHKIIPDRAVFTLFVITVLVFILTGSSTIYLRLLSGFIAGTFLLLLNLITKGRGMGLGDVKLALLGGIILSWPYILTWLFTSFVLGSVVGLALIAKKKAAFGKEIPFGPFLIISLGVTLFWGNVLTEIYFSGLL